MSSRQRSAALAAGLLKWSRRLTASLDGHRVAVHAVRGGGIAVRVSLAGSGPHRLVIHR